MLLALYCQGKLVGLFGLDMQTFFKMNTADIYVPSGVINAHVAVGSLWWFRGLIGVPQITEGHGLFVLGAHRLHTYGIEYAVDFVFLNMDLQIIHIVKGIAAGTLTSYPEAAHLLVLAAGQVQTLDLKLDMVLILAS